jgi:hypothetical protein
MANGDKAQVMIELQLEMKKLKSQLKDVLKEFKGFKKELESLCKTQAECMDDQVKALKKVEAAQAKVAKQWAKGEKEKAKATKQGSKAIQEQEKELGRISKAWEKVKKSGIGKFAGGFTAGAGLAGAGSKLTSARGVGGMFGRGLSRAVGGITGFAVSGITNAYQTYMQYGAAQAGLAGLGRPGDLRGGLRASRGVGGAALGYTPTETVQQARGIGRATGNIGAIYRAQQFGRAYGLDVGEAGGYMGSLRQAGYGFGGEVRGPGGKMTATRREGSRELTKIIEAGMISGLEKGRIGEFLQGVSSITGQLGSQLPGRINVSGIAAQAATLGQSKLPGFQGARGMQLLARLNQAIQKPGGGEAGQSMMMQALGFGKPGGGTRYYEALKMQEQGINDPRNMPKLFKEVYSQLGDPSKGGRAMVNEEANLAMKEITGLSLKQVEELQNIMTSGASTAEQQERIKELMEAAAPIEEQALKVSKEGFLGVAKHIAGVEAKQISIGSTFAPMFMKMQNFQLEMLKKLAEYLPEIVKWLKELYTQLYGIYQSVAKTAYGSEPGKIQDMMERHRKNLESAGVIPKEYKTIGQRLGAMQRRKSETERAIKELEAGAASSAKTKGGSSWFTRTLLPGLAYGRDVRAKSIYGGHLSVLRQRRQQLIEGMESTKSGMKMLGVGPGTPLAPGASGLLNERNRALREGGGLYGGGRKGAQKYLDKLEKVKKRQDALNKQELKGTTEEEYRKKWGGKVGPQSSLGPNRRSGSVYVAKVKLTGVA